MTEKNWERIADHSVSIAAMQDLRTWADGIRVDELAKAERRLRGLTGTERAIVDKVTRRLVSALLRRPTDRLEAASAGSDGARYAEALRYLFALGTEAVVEGAGQEHHVRTDNEGRRP